MTGVDVFPAASLCVCVGVILHSKEREKVPRDERGRFVCERGGEFGLLETVMKKVDGTEKKGGAGVWDMGRKGAAGGGPRKVRE